MKYSLQSWYLLNKFTTGEYLAKLTLFLYSLLSKVAPDNILYQKPSSGDGFHDSFLLLVISVYRLQIARSAMHE